jgi:predicted glycoside hydrolase/deacetylase ChbG (UPF0249 family)
VSAVSDTAVIFRRIWLCADDYGISPSVSLAIRDLAVRGRINATSVMVAAPGLQPSEAAALDIINTGEQRIAIGLHVTLTAPFRPVGKTFRQLRNGAFLPLRSTFIQALRGRFDEAALAEEVTAQLLRFEEVFGRVPDFVDGHQHVHLFPQVRDAVLSVVKEYVPQAWVRQCGSTLPFFRKFGDPKGLVVDTLSRSFRRRAAKLAIKTNPAFAGTYDFKATADIAALFPGFLDRLPDGSLVMCHPGFVDAELTSLDPLTTLREKEYAFFCSDAFADLLAARGVALAH